MNRKASFFGLNLISLYKTAFRYFIFKGGHVAGVKDLDWQPQWSWAFNPGLPQGDCSYNKCTVTCFR